MLDILFRIQLYRSMIWKLVLSPSYSKYFEVDKNCYVGLIFLWATEEIMLWENVGFQLKMSWQPKDVNVIL